MKKRCRGWRVGGRWGVPGKAARREGLVCPQFPKGWAP